MINNKAVDVSELIHQSKKITILSGAGVSTLSGLKDFRSENGLYSNKVYGLTPERILSSYFFSTHRHLFYKYYVNHLQTPETTKPNAIHYATKQLDIDNKLVGVVTQNIDGLYQKAGLPNERLVEIHGNGNEWLCIKCKEKLGFKDIVFNSKTGNYFSPCHNFLVRPNIVLYDELFKKQDVLRAEEMYQQSDLLIVMGTSLDIVHHYNSVRNFKHKICLINNEYVDLKDRAWDAVYLGDIQDVFH